MCMNIRPTAQFVCVSSYERVCVCVCVLQPHIRLSYISLARSHNRLSYTLRDWKKHRAPDTNTLVSSIGQNTVLTDTHTHTPLTFRDPNCFHSHCHWCCCCWHCRCVVFLIRLLGRMCEFCCIANKHANEKKNQQPTFCCCWAVFVRVLLLLQCYGPINSVRLSNTAAAAAGEKKNTTNTNRTWTDLTTMTAIINTQIHIHTHNRSWHTYARANRTNSFAPTLRLTFRFNSYQQDWSESKKKIGIFFTISFGCFVCVFYIF